jgi:hypothetical protein
VIVFNDSPFEKGQIAATFLAGASMTKIATLSHDPDISKQQLELVSHSLKDMKIDFNIFPDQHNHQI